MSVDQRKFVSDILGWIMKISLAIAGFLAVNAFQELKEDTHATRNKVELMDKRMIRLETTIEFYHKTIHNNENN